MTWKSGQKIKVLVVGGTGYLGRKVVDQLLVNDAEVRALVRTGSDSTHLRKPGIQIFEGDLTEPDSLIRPMKDTDAVITSAIGYSRRKKGDSLKTVDHIGNMNLVNIAKEMNISRFVFTSILTAEKAKSVPHFWQKKLVEDYMDKVGLPYVSLRPGAFLDQDPRWDFQVKGLRKGKLFFLGSRKAEWTHILTDDLAKYLALSAIRSEVPYGKMDIGTDRPMSMEMLVQYVSEYMGMTVNLRTVPWSMVRPLLRLGSVFKPALSDLRKMMDYFFTGQYIADTTKQRLVFGEPPSLKESVFRYCEKIGLKRQHSQ